MPRHRPYPDRESAGRELASSLTRLRLSDPVVLALPRGGVPVGRVAADELRAPLDVLLVRKVGAPGQPELGLGAVGEDGVTVLDERLVEAVGATRELVEAIAERERDELRRRAEVYRAEQPAVEVAGRDAIVVDDGIATGGSAAAAVEVVRRRGAANVVVAVPVAAASGLRRLEGVADTVVCPWPVDGGFAVGAFYEDFHQLDDDEVVRLLAAGPGGSGGSKRARRRWR